MKKLLRLSVFIFCVLILCGCNALSRQNNYQLDNKNIIFSLPKVWVAVESNDNELALTRSYANMSFNTYHKSEVNNMSAEELLDQKIEEFCSNHENASLVTKYTTTETADRKIYAKLYTVDQENLEMQYYFSVMEFLPSHTYVYIVYEAKEIYMNYNVDDIQRMLMKMKWTGEVDLALQ